MSSTASYPPPAEPESSQPSSVQPAQDEHNNAPADHLSGTFLNPGVAPPFQCNASLHRLDTASSQAHPTITSPHVPSPSSAGLRLQTDHLDEKKSEESAATNKPIIVGDTQQTVFNAGLPVRTSSLRKAFTRTHRADSLSPASAISSPGVGPLVEMTPLPSPVSPWGALGLGRRSIDDESEKTAPDTAMLDELEEPKPDPVIFPRSTPKKRAIPDDLEQARIYDANAAAYAKNRSISEYVPEGMQIPKSRNIVVSTSGAPSIEQQALSPPEDHMHREHYLAVQRGLAISIPNPPTPPDSNRGTENDEVDSPSSNPAALKGPVPLVYEAYMVRGGKLRRWRALRQLGKGTFSNVMLATSEGLNTSDGSLLEPKNEEQVNPKSLVAVKICELGPAGGADEQKIETSIKREVEIMKSINHPSLVHLKAVNMCERQTLLVLNYCAGGDLFELANLSLDVLTPSLIRRMFAELVAAVRYLHLKYIVHRDIKLENVLVNLPIAAFHAMSDWQNFPHPILTLTDLGLGRWITPESPLLTRRCGSEDYAAPEVLIGQDYDGRATDAWALGVLLYALMEGRLPFDPIPGARRKSPTSHRIARCDWQWVRYADADGEWDPLKGQKLEGAREIVEGLLARTRTRWSLEKVHKTEWVVKGIMIDGGLHRKEEDEGEE